MTEEIPEDDFVDEFDADQLARLGVDTSIMPSDENSMRTSLSDRFREVTERAREMVEVDRLTQERAAAQLYEMEASRERQRQERTREQQEMLASFQTRMNREMLEQLRNNRENQTILKEPEHRTMEQVEEYLKTIGE